MRKQVKRQLRINLEAGKANPAKVGKDLAPTGISLLSFCNQYNDMTSHQAGLLIPADVTVYDDRSFEIITKTPPTAFLLKKYAGVKKGSSKPGREVVGYISTDQLEKIAEIKLPDMNTANLEATMSMVKATASNMGIHVKD